MNPRIAFGSHVTIEVPERVLHFILDYLHVNAINEQPLAKLLKHGRYEFYSKVKHLPLGLLDAGGLETLIFYLKQLQSNSAQVMTVWKSPDFKNTFSSHLGQVIFHAEEEVKRMRSALEQRQEQEMPQTG